MDEREWAEKRATEVRQKREREFIGKAMRRAEDKQRAAEAPRLWREFVGATERRAKSFNEALGEEALQIQTKDENIAVGLHNFLPKVSATMGHLELLCSLINTSARYGIGVIHGTATFTHSLGVSSTEQAVTTDEIAEEFVGSLIKFL